MLIWDLPWKLYDSVPKLEGFKPNSIASGDSYEYLQNERVIDNQHGKFNCPLISIDASEFVISNLESALTKAIMV